MQSVSFKSSIICSFVTVMVVFLLTFMCDLKSRRKIEELETQNKYSQTKIQDIEGQRRKIEELETQNKNSQTKIQDLEGQIYNSIKLYKKYFKIPGLLEDTKREIAEKLKYEDQLNVFLTNLRSNGENEHANQMRIELLMFIMFSNLIQKLEKSKNSQSRMFQH